MARLPVTVAVAFWRIGLWWPAGHAWIPAAPDFTQTFFVVRRVVTAIHQALSDPVYRDMFVTAGLLLTQV